MASPRPVNNMAMYAAIEKFLSKHLEGRFQESMTAEVATRLKEITVDPKTVTLTKPVDTSAMKAADADAQPLVVGLDHLQGVDLRRRTVDEDGDDEHRGEAGRRLSS